MKFHIYSDLALAIPRKMGHISKRKGTEGTNVCLFFSLIYNQQPFLLQGQHCKLTVYTGVYTSVGETIAFVVYADLVI